MTKQEAMSILLNEWAGCRDATGLLNALERIGVVQFDKPRRERLLERAENWRQVGGVLEVTPETLSLACRLICEMADELERSRP